MKINKEARKSWHLLQSLSQKEKQAFEKFLLSQAGKRMGEELKAFKALTRATAGNADKEIIRVFGESAKSDTYMRAIHSRFSKKLREFLAIQALKDSPLKDIMLLEALSEREPTEMFTTALKRIEQKLDEGDERSAAYYRKKFQIKSLQQNHLLSYKTKANKIPFSAALDAFDDWWIHEKISLACYAREQKKLRGGREDSILLKELIQLIKENDSFREKKTLRIFVQYYDFLEEENPAEMPKLESEIKKHIKLFDKEEQHNFFTLIYNFYGRIYIKSRAAEDAHNLISHFQWGVDEQVLLNISWDYYRNIMHLCIQHGFLDEAKKYLIEWEDKLRKKDRKELIPYVKGLIYFQEGLWGKTKRELNLLFKHPLIKIPAAFVYLQALYEEGEPRDLALFKRKLNSIKKYVQKSKHPVIEKSILQHLSRYEYFRQLISTHNQEELLILSRRLNSPEQFPGKTWIQKKVEEKLDEKTRIRN